MPYYKKAPDRVLEMVREEIRRNHKRLRAANFGVLFRSDEPERKGRPIWGSVEIVGDKWRALFPPTEQLHFIMWLSRPWWESERTEQEKKEALLDHLLTSCAFNGVKGGILDPDLMEFSEVIARRGLWHQGLEPAARAIQLYSGGIMGAGKVVTLARAEFDRVLDFDVDLLPDEDEDEEDG